MVSIKLKFRASSIEGKEGSLYYQVIYNRVVRQISTPYRILVEEWDAEKDELVIKQPSQRANYLESIRKCICNDIERLKNTVSILTVTSTSFTVDMIVGEFKKRASGKSFFSHMECMVAQYWRQGQYRTSETYSTTLNSFRRFRGDVDVKLEDVNSELLEAYESYLRQNGLSPNTISFYMKHLRAVYNRAVDDELIKWIANLLSVYPRQSKRLQNEQSR